MKKLLSFLAVLSLIILTSCSANADDKDPVDNPDDDNTEVVEESGFSVLTPAGAPSVILCDYYKNNPDLVTVGDITSVQAALVKEDYDMIIAPSNLGAKLIASGKSAYTLLGVVTTGNLYLVGQADALEQAKEVTLFGENAVPQKIYDVVKGFNNYQYEENYMNSVTDVQPLLLSGKTELALLADPIATITINKAKENGLELTKLVDLQAEYAKATDSQNGYPQACLFVKKDLYVNKTSEVHEFTKALTAYDEKIHNDSSVLVADINEIGVKNLGLPNAEVVATCLDGMGITYKSAFEYRNELKDFLALFDINYTDIQ